MAVVRPNCYTAMEYHGCKSADLTDYIRLSELEITPEDSCNDESPSSSLQSQDNTMEFLTDNVGHFAQNHPKTAGECHPMNPSIKHIHCLECQTKKIHGSSKRVVDHSCYQTNIVHISGHRQDSHEDDKLKTLSNLESLIKKADIILEQNKNVIENLLERHGSEPESSVEPTDIEEEFEFVSEDSLKIHYHEPTSDFYDKSGSATKTKHKLNRWFSSLFSK